jgi:hypothetical protein
MDHYFRYRQKQQLSGQPPYQAETKNTTENKPHNTTQEPPNPQLHFTKLDLCLTVHH